MARHEMPPWISRPVVHTGSLRESRPIIAQGSAPAFVRFPYENG
jgi:hypothetical protein